MSKEAPNTATTLIYAFATIALIVIVALFLPAMQPILTARPIALEKVSFSVNEPIQGDFSMMLQEGELIPVDTNVAISVNDLTKELSLEEFVTLSNLDLEPRQGNFYIKGTSISDSGLGYGWLGQHISYPTISFKLKITKINEANNPGNPSHNSSNPHNPSHNPGHNPTINGFSILNFFKKFFNIFGFAVFEEDSEIIEGTCTATDPFIYQLDEGETAQLIEGSVMIDGQSLGNDIITLTQEGTLLNVSTSYKIEEEGFGQEFLTDITYEIALSLGSLGLILTEPGDYILTIILTYQGQELLKESAPLTITEKVEEIPEAELEEQITTQQLAKVNGKKVEDDPTFETTIWSASRDQEAGTLILIFSHNSIEEQPIWIEELEPLNYELSANSSLVNENVTLIVYFKERLPKFRLHVGTTSEIFEFGDPPAPLGAPAACNCSSCDDCEAKLNDPSCTEVKLTANITNHSATCIYNPTNFSNKTFDCQGHTIDGTGAYFTYGIYLNGKSNNTIKNCVVTDFTSGIYLRYSSNNNITNNNASSNNSLGIRLDSNSNNNIITNNTANSNDQHGILLIYSSNNNTITNNTANSNADGISLSESSNNNITNNNANSNNYYGIYLSSSSDNNIITNNTANSNDQNGIFFISSSNNSITNNTAKLNSQYGIHVYDLNSVNNTFTSNDLCTNNGSHDIYDKDANTFTNNYCNPGRKYTNSQALNCDYTCTGACTCINCDDCENKLNDPACTTVLLTENITNHSGTCINDPTNFSNKTFDCQGHTIDGDDSWSDNGIYLNGKSGNTIKNCVVTDFAYGILLSDSSNNTITNNTANSNDPYGIYLQSSSNNNITDNNASSNDHGIYLISSSNNNTITNNTANSNDHYGIRLYSSSNNVITSNIANNHNEEGKGIYLDSSSNNNTITNNTANNNTKYGIHLNEGSSNTITNNTANSNDWGIFLSSSSNNNLTNNKANDNTDSGIYLYFNSNNNTVTNNTAKLNSQYGIHVYDLNSVNNTFTSNDLCTNNGSHDIYDKDTNTFTNNYCNSGRKYTNSQNLSCDYTCTGACTCVNCTDCTAKLNDSSCTEVKLTADIIDHAGTCIYNPVNFSNKTFDCQGHTIDGTDYGYGIYINGKTNNTIKNCIVTDFAEGIFLHYNSNNNTIINNTLNSNTDCGIDIENSLNNNITNNIANSNTEAGIYIYHSSNNSITNNNANNSYLGIYLQSGSKNNNLKNNTANNNNNCGISLYYNSNNNILTNNIANNNTYNGIYLYRSSNNILTNNVANHTTHKGINLDWYSNNNILINNIANDNEYGIFIVSSSNNNILTSNTINSNNYGGIHLWSSSNNTIINSSAINNMDSDFYSDMSSQDNTVKHLGIGLNYPTTISFTYDYGVKIKSVESQPSDPPGWQNISKYVNATNVTSDSWCFLNISYNESELGNVSEDTLRTWKYNETNWSQVPVTGVNTDENYTYANITNFSVFAPLGSTACYCYNCSDCMEKLNDTSCQIVYLAQNITSNGTCINNPANFSNKTFDCQGNTIEYATTEAGHGIWSSSPFAFNATVRNCAIKAAAGSFNYCGGSNPSCYGIYWNNYNGVIENNTIIIVGSGYPNSNDGIVIGWGVSGNKVLKNNITTAGRGFGILLFNCGNNNVTMNRIATMGWMLSYGIYIYEGNSNIIDRNNITTHGDMSYGIYIRDSPNNVITNNNIITHGTRTSAIYASGISSNSIIANHLTTTRERSGATDGITLSTSSNITIKDNVMNTTGWAITFSTTSDKPQHYNHTMENNTERGEPIDYYFNEDSIIIEDIDYIGELIVGYSRNVTIRNMTLDKDGIILGLVENSIAKENNIINLFNKSTAPNIYLLFSNHTNITDNNITTRGGPNSGISFYSSSNNRAENNNIDGKGPVNSDSLIYGDLSNDNIIQSNNITTAYEYGKGIWLRSCSGNDIIDNNIIAHNIPSTSIYLDSSTFNNLVGNNITTTAANTDGLRLMSNSANNNVTANIFDNADRSIKIEGSANNIFKHNVIKSSDVNFSFSYSGGIKIKKVSTPPADPPDYINISKYLDITNSTPAWMFLNISYNESELGNVSEDTLRIWKHNGTWWNETFYSVSGINTAENYTYANITDFSIFAPLGQPGPTCPYWVNADWNLTENISCPATALIANASNIIIDCQGHSINYSSADVGYGIFAQHKNNITIKNCKIMQTNSSGVCQNDSIGIFFNCYASACSNINILNNSVRVCGDETNTSTEGNYAMTLRQLWDSNLIGNDVTSIKYSGIKLTGRSKRCLVKANRVTSPGHAIYFHAEKVYDSIVENNNVTSTNWVGIFVHAGTGNVIRNNLVNDSHDGIGSWGNNTTIINNNITTFGYGITISKNANNNITGNNITGNNAGSGISLGWLYLGDYFPSNNNIIQHNLISNFKEGIHLEANSENNNIRDNNITISSNNGYGVYTDNSSDNNVTSNNIITTGNYGHGINLYSSSNNNIVDENNVTTAGSHGWGISLDDSNSTNITGNNIKTSDEDADAIRLDSDSYYNRIESNTIETFGDFGFGINFAFYNNDHNSVIGNDIITNGSTARAINIGRNSTENNITDNNVTTFGSSAHAIQFFSGGKNSIIKNNILFTKGSESYCILFRSALNNLLENNVVISAQSWDFYSVSNSLNNTVINLTMDHLSQPTVSFTSKDIAMRAANKTNDSPPYRRYYVGPYVNTTNNSADSWCFLNLTYNQTNIPEGKSESEMELWRWVGIGNWHEVLGSGVDMIQDYVYGNITNFSIFMPLVYYHKPARDPPKVVLNLSSYDICLNETIALECKVEAEDQDVGNVTITATQQDKIIDWNCIYDNPNDRANCYARYEPSTARIHTIICEAEDKGGKKGSDTKQLNVSICADCDETCQKQGYITGICRTNEPCKPNETDIGETEDCKSETKCIGSCPHPQKCELVQTKQGLECDCKSEPCEYNTELGECMGVCPPGQICELFRGEGGGVGGGVGTISCKCVEPTCEYNTELGECMGVCPPGQICNIYIDQGGIINCRCINSTCSVNTEKNGCIGSCPPGQECELYREYGIIGCRCVPSTEPTCSYNPEGEDCIGSCPPGQECKLFAEEGKVECKCVPKPESECEELICIESGIGTAPIERPDLVCIEKSPTPGTAAPAPECVCVKEHPEAECTEPITPIPIPPPVPCESMGCVEERDGIVIERSDLECVGTAPYCSCVEVHPEAECVEPTCKLVQINRTCCCFENITNCEQLQELFQSMGGLEAGIEWNDNTKNVTLDWDPQLLIDIVAGMPNAELTGFTIYKSLVCIGPECNGSEQNWSVAPKGRINDISAREWSAQDPERLSFYKVIANVEVEENGTIIYCPISSSVFTKFSQELKITENTDTSVNWIVNFLPATTNPIITQDVPVITDSLQLLELARPISRYHGMWPSDERFAAYMASIRVGELEFMGPYVSRWNALHQGNEYCTAWGMSPEHEPVAVGIMDMEIGKPYFMSPDAEGVVTWVGGLPKTKVFEFKIKELEPGIFARENFIALPLNTEIRTAKDLCNDMIAKGIMTGTDYISKWDVQTQTPIPLPQCFDVNEIPDNHPEIQLTPGVPYLITVTNPGSWTQE